MKHILLLAFLLFSVLTGVCQVRVRGYYRANGTYVRPHYRSRPDGNPYNNYSYPGNTNPYTGKTATGNPDTYLKNHGSSSQGKGGSNILLAAYREMDFRSIPTGTRLKVEALSPLRKDPDSNSSKVGTTDKEVIFQGEANEDFIRVMTLDSVYAFLKKDWVSVDVIEKFYADIKTAEDLHAKPFREAEFAYWNVKARQADSIKNVKLNALVGKIVEVALYTPVHSKPSESAPILTHVENLKVRVLSRPALDYFLVDYKGKRGYVQDRFIVLN